MRAITVEPKGAGTIAEPDPGDGPVLVEAIAVGVCGTDAEIAEGKYSWPPRGKTRLVKAEISRACHFGKRLR
jgi:D-arabinose 1-dehydrogenase-like Zn-dependent alcohol dehydrogenase